MKVEAVPVEVFRARFGRAVARAGRALGRVRKKPTTEAVHEARRAVRKVRVVVSLMPKRYRTNTKVKKALRRLDRFYSASTEVRNLDVVSRSIQAHSRYPGVHALLTEALHERSAAVEGSLGPAKGAGPSLPPPLEDSQARLQGRLENQVRRRAESILALCPKVVSDERNVKELHDLRKGCRELNDLLGLAKKSRGVAAARVTLESERRQLGSIRDDDVVLEHLERWNRSAEVRRLWKTLTETRRRRYRTFLSRQENGGATVERVAEGLFPGYQSDSIKAL